METGAASGGRGACARRCFGGLSVDVAEKGPATGHVEGMGGLLGGNLCKNQLEGPARAEIVAADKDEPRTSHIVERPPIDVGAHHSDSQGVDQVHEGPEKRTGRTDVLEERD